LRKQHLLIGASLTPPDPSSSVMGADFGPARQRLSAAEEEGNGR